MRSLGKKVFFFCNSGRRLRKKWWTFAIIRRFSLRCLKKDIIPVSIRLKTNIRTIRGMEIIRKTERKLLNECIRSINNSLELYTYERDSIVQQLEEKLEQDHSNLLEECQDFIKRIIECRHHKLLV